MQGPLGTKERRERERQETRARILDAARDMFVQDGVEAVTMRAIAKRIEYTPTAIYHHFRDKDALLRELCLKDFRALAQAFLKIGKIEDPLARLERIGQAYIDFGLENPSQYRFMFMTAPKTEVDELDKNNPEENAYAFLRETVAECIARGRFTDGYRDPDRVAQMCWAMAHGIVSLHIIFQDDEWVDWREPKQTGHAAMHAMVSGMLR